MCAVSEQTQSVAIANQIMSLRLQGQLGGHTELDMHGSCDWISTHESLKGVARLAFIDDVMCECDSVWMLQ